MKTIAIITARGGSKRIPRKNIKEFCGQPIIAYSIQAAIDSGMFDEVMVSTDDEQIAEISERLGAKVPFKRSEKTSGDHATTADVIKEVLESYQEIGQSFEYFCCIYPTAPFVTADKLKEAMAKLIDSKQDSLLPVVRFSFPPQRCVVIRHGRVAMKWPEHMSTRSQDLEPLFHDCGQFYMMKTTVFLKENKLITDNTIPYEISEIQVQDIDSESDWELAEIKYSKLMRK